jgi:hypothetical protein
VHALTEPGEMLAPDTVSGTGQVNAPGLCAAGRIEQAQLDALGMLRVQAEADAVLVDVRTERETRFSRQPFRTIHAGSRS